MDRNTNELEQFIYKICYQKLWETVNTYISCHPTLLDLRHCRVKYPETAFIEDMLLEFTRNIRIDEDTLSFEAVLSCTLQVTDDASHSAEVSQWLLVSCDAVVEDRLKSLTIRSVSNYTPGTYKPLGGTVVSPNIVPMLCKKELETEAESFLEKYYPAALEKPTPVPIAEIAAAMGLDIVQGYRITDDFSIFGEICFSPGQVEIFDLFECSKMTLDVKRGTIIIDAYTFWERNIGCVNNTIAHEVYHWYKHRLYADLKQILRNEKMIACRCPVNEAYSGKSEEWTDEQRMEWQANKMAPRILMPLKTFRMKVDELYKRYRYEDSLIKHDVLTRIADDLAKFYDVSRQSVLIRMMETGYGEAAGVYQRGENSDFYSYISTEDAFREYSNNSKFQELVDSGLFKYVDGYFVINDSQYIEKDDDGRCRLTEYAWANLDECTLKFSWETVRKDSKDKHLPSEILHRDKTDQKVSKCSASENEGVVKRAEALKRKREEFEQQKAMHRLTTPNFTCWEVMYSMIDARGLSKPHFCSLTGLGEEVYRKAEKM